MSAGDHTVLCNRMLDSLRQPYKFRSKQVRSLFNLLYLQSHFFSSSPGEPRPSPPLSSPETNDTHIDLSSINISGIAKSVIGRFSQHCNSKGDAHGRPSLKSNLLNLSSLSPGTIRRFWRVSELNPHEILELLRGFEWDNGNSEIEAKKIESLWGIFKWGSEQSRDFKHLPESCKIMAAMLVRIGFLEESELLLSTFKNREILLDCNEIFSKIVEGYANSGELGKAVSIYERMRGLGLVPPLSSYRALLDSLVQIDETQLAFRVYKDMLDMGFAENENGMYEKIIQLLCKDGKIMKARNLVKTAFGFGIKPSNPVINTISYGYCKKKDYDDIVSFFVELKCAPDVVLGNKIVSSICRNFGTNRANFFMRKFENLGFCPNETTFGILIGRSCKEGELKNAFFYLSEVLSRNLKPLVHSYNALIGGVFKEGLWKNAQDILQEMDEMGIKANFLTFKVLLAGYCKARQFDEAKSIIFKMSELGLIRILHFDDPLSKCFTVLGLDPLTVRVRRDNSKGLSKAEFFDNLGNGLYLDTDLEEYEKTMNFVLDSSSVPDFDFLVLNSCLDGNFEMALEIVDEMVLWGHEMTILPFSTLIKGLCSSRRQTKAVADLLEKMVNLTHQLDQEALNLVVQALRKKGFVEKAREILNIMRERRLEIENQTYTDLLSSLFKKGKLSGINDCWNLARRDKWVPESKDVSSLLIHLCKQKMPEKAFELLKTTLTAYPLHMLNTCHVFIEKLCDFGYTSFASVSMEELLNVGYVLNHRVTYSHLVRGFCKEKKFQEAFKILNIMLDKDLAPPHDVYAILVPRLCKAGHFQTAAALKEIILRQQPLDSISVYHSLMLVEQSACLFHDMLSRGLIPDSEVYNTMIKEYCRAKNMAKIHEIIGLMIRKNSNFSISVFRNLVRLMFMENRVRFGLNLKTLFFGENNSSDLVVYNILIFYLFWSGNSSLVDSILDELKSKKLKLDGASYNFIIYGFSRCKSVSIALDYLYMMISDEIKPSNRCLRAVISGLCRAREMDKALQVSHEMETRGWIHGSIIQNDIVESLLNRGKIQEAVDFLDRMVKKRLVPEKINYDNLIKLFCRCGRQDEAVFLVDIMLKNGCLPDSTSYDCLIQGLCNKNRELISTTNRELLNSTTNNKLLNSAMDRELLNSTMDRELNSTINRKLLNSTINRELLNSTTNRELNSSRNREFFNSTMDCKLLNSTMNRDLLNSTMDFLTEMLERDLKPSVETWNAIIHRLCECGEIEEAEKLLNSMAKIGETPSKEMYSCVINRWRLENNFQKAAELLQAMQKDGCDPDFETHWSVISNLGGSGDKEKNNRKNRPFLSRLLSDSGFV